jgi:choline dehydrogenase-like flavoprotein
LRVIEATGMPTMPDGDANAPTIMIAEHTANLLKLDKAYFIAAR